MVTELKCVEDDVREDQFALLLLRNIKVKDFQTPCPVLKSKPREDMLVDTFSTHLLEYVENAEYSFDPATEATSCLEKLRGNHRVRVPLVA